MPEPADSTGRDQGLRSTDARPLADHPLAARFEQFVDEAQQLACPFYAQLAALVSRDAAMLDLAAHCRAMPVPNLFFSAIHYLLWRDSLRRQESGHRLAEHFPSLRASPRRDELLLASLQSFCRDRRGEIQHQLETRRVQTNEVARCGAFVPAFQFVFERAGGRPLALVDIGTSAGLNLLWDQFAYWYDATLAVGPADSPVQITCELRGAVRPPVLAAFPTVGRRIGLDLDPVDLSDPDQRLWLESLVWPDHAQRLARLQAAIGLALKSPPQIVRGDACAALPDIMADVPRDLTCCLFHSASFNQLGDEQRSAIDRQLVAASTTRDIYRIAAEFQQLVLHTYRGGDTHTETELAAMDSHGRWLEWKAGRSAVQPG